MGKARWKQGTLWDVDMQQGENYLFELHAQNLPTKFIAAQGEKLVSEQLISAERLKEIVGQIAMDCDENVDTEPASHTPSVQMVAGDGDATMAGKKKKVTPEALHGAVENMKKVWDENVCQYVYAKPATSQFLAYEQLTFRQEHGDPLLVCLHAGAGYGKSHLILTFLKHEELHSRAWAVLAPSGVAAQNVGGVAVHFFFQMRGDYTSRLEPESAGAAKLQQTQGLIIDEFTMCDVVAWRRMRRLCEEYPLEPHLRKKKCVEVFRLPRCVACRRQLSAATCIRPCAIGNTS